MSDKLKTMREVCQLKADNMEKMKETYAALAIEPDIFPFTETMNMVPLFARSAVAMISGKHFTNFCA